MLGFRCRYPVDDYHARVGEWTNATETPECDIIQVRCADTSGNITYEYLHSQVFVPWHLRKAEEALAGNPNRPPDVHMLILDSTSSPQLMRSMPKSVRFMEEEMGAINFRYVTNIKPSSRASSYAMTMGKSHTLLA